MKNEAYFPHSSSQNCHLQIRWSLALGTAILSFPSPRHRRRASLIFHLTNSQHAFDWVSHLLNSYIRTSVTIFVTKLLEQTVSCNSSVYKVAGSINYITLLIAVLYYNNHPYYTNRNKEIDLFVVSIITIVTGMYDSR